MYTESNKSNITFLFFGTAFVSALFLAVGLCIFFLLPSDIEAEPFVSEESSAFETVLAQTEQQNEDPFELPVLESKLTVTSKKSDPGLDLYRQPNSRPAVEWFYTHITSSREVALAILEAADKDNIPVSLAFALAYTESRYNVRAVNVNTNSTVDRGLFQLNNKTFPKLTEDEFFDPHVSAQYGMSHLRFCLNSAGNEVAALAMYNAGTNKVRSNSTPQTTLNYVSKIISYKTDLESLFAGEVLAFYDVNTEMRLAKN